MIDMAGINMSFIGATNVSNPFNFSATSTRYKGVNISMKSNGTMVISVLGNMMAQHEFYVREVLDKSEAIVADVAYRHLMGLSRNKNKSSFFSNVGYNKPYDDGGEMSLPSFTFSKSQFKEWIVTSWGNKQSYMKEVWSDKLWDFYKVPAFRISPQTVNLALNTAYYPVVGFYVFGTQPHWIYPSKKKALAFFWQKHNRFVYAKFVRHPGAKAHPQVMTEINRKSIRRIKEMIRTARTAHGIGVSKLQALLGFGRK